MFGSDWYVVTDWENGVLFQRGPMLYLPYGWEQLGGLLLVVLLLGSTAWGPVSSESYGGRGSGAGGGGCVCWIVHRDVLVEKGADLDSVFVPTWG